MRISTAIIGVSESHAQSVERALAQLGGVTVARRLNCYPDSTETVRMLRAADPDVLFISTDDPSQMERTALQATHALPSLQVVLVDSSARSETLRRAMQLGIRECLSVPFDQEDLRGVMERCLSGREMNAPAASSNCLYSFLPARPGVGATTLAIHSALSLPQTKDRAFLVDTDVEAGMIQFLLQLANPYSFVEAIERVEELDEHLWPQLVSEIGGLDVMQAGDGGEDYRIDLARLQHLIAFARRQYGAILIDLPSAINRLSVEIMHQSKTIFLVTTPEVAALHMARQRLRQLQELQLSQQVRLIVNRFERKGKITLDEIAKAVGIPAHVTFSNDYSEVQKSLLAGTKLGAQSTLGREVMRFAQTLATGQVTAEPLKRRRFMEVFSLSR